MPDTPELRTHGCPWAHSGHPLPKTLETRIGAACQELRDSFRATSQPLPHLPSIDPHPLLSLSLSHTHRHTHVLSLYSQQWLLGSISGSTFPEESPSALRGKRWGGVEREEREKRWGQEREAGRQASGTGRRMRLKRGKKKRRTKVTVKMPKNGGRGRGSRPETGFHPPPPKLSRASPYPYGFPHSSSSSSHLPFILSAWLLRAVEWGGGVTLPS